MLAEHWRSFGAGGGEKIGQRRRGHLASRRGEDETKRNANQSRPKRRENIPAICLVAQSASSCSSPSGCCRSWPPCATTSGSPIRGRTRAGRRRMVRAEKGVGCIFAGSWEIGGWGVVVVKCGEGEVR